MKKWICCLLALLLTLTAFAAFAEDDEDEDTVAVTVNGEDIMLSEFEEMVSTISSRMSSYGIDSTDEEVIALIESSALQELVEDRLLTQDMTEQGCYETTEEEEEEIVTQAKEMYDSLLQEYEEYFAEYFEDSEASAFDLAETFLVNLGYSLEYLENYYRNVLASEKYEEWLMQDEDAVTDEEVQEAYEERVAASEEAYADDVEAFETALASGEEVWYRPDGYRAILQIMISTEGDDEDEQLASVQDTIDEIYARLEAGESFESLIAEYGEDTAFDDEDFYDTGYQVHEESIIWDEAFVEAAFGDDMNEPGDYSDVILYDGSVHILYYLKDVEGGAVELTSTLFEALRTDIANDRCDELLEERLEYLTENAEIIYYIDVD